MASMYKFLDKEQRQELLDELSIERSKRYADRIRVILLLDDNKTYKNISEYLFLDEGSIANYRKRYIEGGIEGLILDEYSTKRTKLNIFEEFQLANELDDRIFASTKEVVAIRSFLLDGLGKDKRKKFLQIQVEIESIFLGQFQLMS